MATSRSSTWTRKRRSTPINCTVRINPRLGTVGRSKEFQSARSFAAMSRCGTANQSASRLAACRSRSWTNRLGKRRFGEAGIRSAAGHRIFDQIVDVIESNVVDRLLDLEKTGRLVFQDRHDGGFNRRTGPNVLPVGIQLVAAP